MTVTRKISALIFLLLVLMPLLFFICTQIKQYAIYAEMKEKLEVENLVTVTVNPEDVKWVKPQKEAMIQGEMFDVKEIRESNGKLFLTGLFDKKEKELNKIASDYQKQKQQEPTGTSGASFFFLALYDNVQVDYDLSQYSLLLIHHACYSRVVSAGFPENCTPPPNSGC